MFAYCNNNPIVNEDATGKAKIRLFEYEEECEEGEDSVAHYSGNEDYIYAPNGHTIKVRWSHGNEARARGALTATYYSPNQLSYIVEDEKRNAYIENSAAKIGVTAGISFLLEKCLYSKIPMPSLSVIVTVMTAISDMIVEANRSRRASAFQTFADRGCGMIVVEYGAYMAHGTVYLPWDGTADSFGIDFGRYPYAYNREELR